ncbi:Gcp-like domain-containing protein [Panaeolus papilionaceus]|nr:Gcp-like domain-containing protein [Panaeolus papilionaceus]
MFRPLSPSPFHTLRRCHFSSIQSRRLTILALESSADDTCAAIVDSSRRILSNVVIKQHDIHEAFGGIEPISAIHGHQQNMPVAIRRALDEASMDIGRDIDGIAFTRGPGMPGCLSVGLNSAKALAASLNKPLVGVNHMQAHALTALLTSPPATGPKFPFLTLLISGGHTLLVLATSVRSFKILASSRDESIGRTFDKVSKLLSIKWTALGPGDALERFCEENDDIQTPVSFPTFPRPLMGQLAFSYSGLHSHAKNVLADLGGIANIDTATRRSIAREFQTAAVAQLEEKLKLGLRWCQMRNIPVKDLVLSGGVASNQYLRSRMQQSLVELQPEQPIATIYPPPHLCTDNAVMIAWASIYRFLDNDTDAYTIGLRPKWSLEEL